MYLEIAAIDRASILFPSLRVLRRSLSGDPPSREINQQFGMACVRETDHTMVLIYWPS